MNWSWSTVITHSSYSLPTRQVTTASLEWMIQERSSITIKPWLIDFVLWTAKRYRTTDHEYSSTLAIRAIESMIKDNSALLQEVDLFIYASTTQDCTEPSTACIVMNHFWMSCASFDIQNACNSVLSAISTAHMYLRSKKYSTILICSGETPSKAIKMTHDTQESYKQSFSSFWFWDCGTAMILKSSLNEWWILYEHAISDPSLRKEATILWWWSRYPKSCDNNFFIWNPSSLKSFFLTQWIPNITIWLKTVWRSLDDVDHIFVHQVSHDSYHTMIDALWQPEEKFTKTYTQYWNMWSCTVIFQMVKATLCIGKKYLFIWLGAWGTFSYIIYLHTS